MGKINKDSTVKCDNHSRYLFFNCTYTGKPTTKIPKWLRYLSPNNPWGPRRWLRISHEQWGRYIMEENYFCPKCGKEMTDKNLLENFKEVEQSQYYRVFVIVFIVSIFILIYQLYHLAAGQSVVDWKMLYYFSACLISFILMLVLKK